MNYLFQAYACSSHQGGEYAVSWGWILHLSNAIGPNDTIYVLSLTLSEQDIENANLNNVRLLHIDGLEKYTFLNYNVLYQAIWQKKAYQTAKNANIKFDFVHIYSLSDFRKPGNWYKIADTYKVFGPVGGGQICPKGLRKYDTNAGKIRELINSVYKFNPFYKNKLKKFKHVYACNKETQSYLPGSEVLIDVPLRDDFVNLIIHKDSPEVPTILFTGRLINKKGILVLLDALKLINNDIKYKTLIYGEGAQKNIIKDKIQELGLENKVNLMGKVPYAEMSKVYEIGQIFVLPSLRESGGSVLIEAMAHKLPIVAFDMSLAHILNEHHCGLFVDINQSTDDILKQLASNLTKLILHPELRKIYGDNGYRFVNTELTWDNMINQVYSDFIKTT